MTNEKRLKRIAEIIEKVDNRCMAVDGPVTPTLEEMTQKEISEIYKLASHQTESSGRDDTEPKCTGCVQIIQPNCPRHKHLLSHR